MPAASSDAERVDAFRAIGQPVHTRALEISVRHGGPGLLDVRGAIRDLRKLGFVPTGGDLQTAGVIHDMSLAGRVDAESLVVESLEPAQAVVAFEAGPRTGGESCRDTIPRLRGLAGARLDDAFSRRLSDVYGGPLGCSHLLTLAHLLAATVPRAAAWERDARSRAPADREPGERLFDRSLVLDGLELDEGRKMDVAVQLSDVFTRPFALAPRPLDRFERQHEVRLLARVDMATMTFETLGARERTRSGPPVEAGAWQDRDGLLAPFVGGPAVSGLARAVRDHLGDAPEHQALRDVLRNFAPGLIQCLAASANRMVEGMGAGSGGGSGRGDRSGQEPVILQFGGLPDSCYIWRDGGPGLRERDRARDALD